MPPSTAAPLDKRDWIADLLMLALGEPAALTLWLRHTTLKAYTSHTITDKAKLKTELSAIRVRGWAISEHQLELGFRGIAVPLLNRDGELQGGLNVSLVVGQESSADALARVLPVLQETARAMRNLV